MNQESQIQFVKSSLSKLLNNKVVYGVSEFTIMDYKLNNYTFMVYVDDRDMPFEFTIDRAVDFVRECKVFNSKITQATPVNKQEVKAQDADNIAETLKNTILECIEKVKLDKSYIPQANAINSQIQTLLNLKKLEIETAKLQRLLGGGVNKNNV